MIQEYAYHFGVEDFTGKLTPNDVIYPRCGGEGTASLWPSVERKIRLVAINDEQFFALVDLLRLLRFALDYEGMCSCNISLDESDGNHVSVDIFFREAEASK